MAFAPWSAALAGFRLVRERPWATLAWAGVIFLGRLAGLALTTAISGPYMPALDAAVNADPIKVEAVTVAYQNVAPGFLAGAALVLPFFAVVIAAIYRAYLKPQEQQGFFLRLGVREGTMLGLIVALNILVMFGLSFGIAVIATFAKMIATADAAAGATMEALGFIALAIVALMVLVRLSLAWPMSFEIGRPWLFRSWRMTQGYSWRLLGAYVMAEGLMVVVGALLFAVCACLAGVVLITQGGVLEQLPDALHSAIRVDDVFQPIPLIFSVFEALVLALGLTSIQGVAVSAYRTLPPPPPVPAPSA